MAIRRLGKPSFIAPAMAGCAIVLIEGRTKIKNKCASLLNLILYKGYLHIDCARCYSCVWTATLVL